MVTTTDPYVFAARRADFPDAGCLTVQVEGHTLALFAVGERVYAVDNRCPHMGFPLNRGTVRDGILTCHWHHARFDLASGGTFDLWADDVRAFPVEVRGDAIWVDVTPPADRCAHDRRRLGEGLRHNLPLVIAKAVIALLEEGGDGMVDAFRAGLDFGTLYREAGWGQGLTILACLMNLLPYLDEADHAHALYHGLSAVAGDTAGGAPRFPAGPLPGLEAADLPMLKRWFRRFVAVRDAQGAERCLASAVRAGADARQMADMLFAAATDHRYISTGHPLDFTNKALEALDIAGWDQAEQVLGSLAHGYATAERMEEANAWRNPVDLIAILDDAFERLPSAMKSGHGRRGLWSDEAVLIEVLLGDDPAASARGLLEALREGCPEARLARIVSTAAVLRIARFHTSNEFGDWDTALHTFTFANAVHQGLRRIREPLPGDAYVPLLRGVFDAAMSVYLDRFLNVPAARLPEPDGTVVWDPDVLLLELPKLLDRQQQVAEAGQLVAGHLYVGGAADRLLAALGHALLREDRDFHTIQTVEAAFRLYALLQGSPEASHVLVAAARYLAAHAPTTRAQGQTFHIAARLSRGDRLFEGD